MAWAAFCAGEIVGVARWVRLGEEPRTAEVAAYVLDAFQRRGLGRLLLDAVAASALRRSVDQFAFYVLPVNRPVLGMLRWMGVSFKVRDGMMAGGIGVEHLLAENRLTG